MTLSISYTVINPMRDLRGFQGRGLLLEFVVTAYVASGCRSGNF